MKTISDRGLINKIKKAKTSKGKRFLEKREPQLVEEIKKAVFCRSSTANQSGVQLLKDIQKLKKPNATYLNRKESWQPFENATDLEFVTRKNDCALFAYASHSKKRPNNLILGRTHNGQILDMVEFGFENFKALSEFQVEKISSETKPILLFSGELFDNQPDFQRIKSLLLDFFVGPNIDQVNLTGIEHVIQFVEVDRVIHMRSYRIFLKKSGVKLPRVELQEIGPRVDLTLRRSNLASIDLFKKTLKQPDQVLKQVGKMKKPEEKNISKDVFGTKLGRIHMERQDYGRLRLRKGGAFKAKAAN
ncbi:PREDICTED: ribosome production factor 2 homolog [Rhagoletis zephyria]|uniref:ribosome production factor 2 homolog n=1 Tax=Rhagoletis zephyria TaxID=28612 RepID=UPI0008119CE4|nr:PREDICTED: ribosome production factor 2 homolog [Rhagoletis zephyria]